MSCPAHNELKEQGQTSSLSILRLLKLEDKAPSGISSNGCVSSLGHSSAALSNKSEGILWVTCSFFSILRLFKDVESPDLFDKAICQILISWRKRKTHFSRSHFQIYSSERALTTGIGIFPRDARY